MDKSIAYWLMSSVYIAPHLDLKWATGFAIANIVLALLYGWIDRNETK